VLQVDLPVSFGSASLLAAALERGRGSDRWASLYQRGLATSLIFQVLFAVWLPVYLLVRYFGFQTSHMWWRGDSITDYPTLLPAFLVLYFLANLAGFHTGAWLVGRGRARTARGIFVGSFVYFAAWMALQPYRTLSLGTFQQWQAGTAPWVWTDPQFMGVLATGMVVFFAVIAWCYRALQRAASTGAAGV